MSKDAHNIEERLIPYLEGVLSATERQEVEAAIAADATLAREVSDLREVIGELRQGFASGVVPPQESLTPEEIVRLSAHQGGLENMPGSSQEKTRLFCSDQAVHEYELLRSLSEEMRITTLAIEDIPPIPEAVLAQIREMAEVRPPAPPVLEEEHEKVVALSLWRRAGAYLDRLDPRPLMATAAALALVSLGIHSYGSSDRQNESALAGQPSAVSYGGESQASATPQAPASPNGVTVFASSDRDLLKAQAEKLLAKKIRYTVTQDRILVPEKEVAVAREVLWGEEGAKAVAMGEATPKDSVARTVEEMEQDEELTTDPPPTAEAPQAYLQAGEAAPPPSDKAAVKSYDYRANRSQNSYNAQDMGYLEQSSKAAEPSSAAPQWSPPKSEAAPVPDRVDPPTTGTASASVATPRASGSDESRRQMLKDLALGRTPEEKASSEGGETITRARARGDAPAAAKRAPVANVVTADDIDRRETVGEVAGGAVASSAAPDRQTAPIEAESEASIPLPAPASVAAATKPATVTPSGADMRLVEVRRVQAEVARRYNVVISVESDGSAISVYVRPKKELSKPEIDELRRSIRADLGLADADSIVIR